MVRLYQYNNYGLRVNWCECGADAMGFAEVNVFRLICIHIPQLGNFSVFNLLKKRF